MGNTCCSICVTEQSKHLIALKLPHGSKGVAWRSNWFQQVDINNWLSDLYSNTAWTGYVCYNDELPDSHHTTKGHCKGILTWNETRIGWLIHSVPRFPQAFTGSSISPIGSSELIYGQSFLYVEQARTNVRLEDVLRQILWMKPNLFHSCNVPTVSPYNSRPLEIKRLQWHKTMVHLAKSPEHTTDFIGTELCTLDTLWHEQTWKRGSEYPATNNKVISVHSLCVQNTAWTSSQDHSKWAISPTKVWIGDLNHMKSQEKRGGGGMVLMNKGLAAAFHSLIKSES